MRMERILNQTSISEDPNTQVSGCLRDSLYLAVYGITGIFAIIGNTIVVKVVFTIRKMQTFVHVLLANMALSDLMCGVTFFLGLFLCSDYFIDVWGGNGYCVANKAIQLLSFQVSSVTMTVVAIDRWFAVFHPFSHRKQPYGVHTFIIIIWLAAIAMIVGTSPSLGYQRYFNKDGTIIKCDLAKAFDIFSIGNDTTYQRIQLIVANLLHFWIPLTVICVAYGSITIEVLRRGSEMKEDVTKTQEDIMMIQRWKTIKMLIAAVSVFILCWIPFWIFNIIAFTSDSSKKRPCNQTVTFYVVIWLAFSSCCYNPFVYWIYNENYRDGILGFFKTIICRQSWNWPPAWRRTGRGSTEPIHT